MLKRLPVQNLKPGMVIVRVTRQNGPVKIRKSGLVSSHDMVQGLFEMGIQEVEIDPAQTVEIEETEATHQSSTLQLLQTSGGQPAQPDGHLHDQFNRSLFLPSVQDIPSVWQFYLKRYGLLVLLICGGFGLGFSAALVSQLLVIKQIPPLVAESTENDPGPVLQSSQSKPQENLNSAEQATEKQANNVATTTQEAGQQSLSEQADESRGGPESAQQTQSVQAELAQSQSRESAKIEQNTRQAVADVSHNSATETTDKVENLSPELVKRFENVIKQMDAEKRAGISSPSPTSVPDSYSALSGEVLKLRQTEQAANKTTGNALAGQQVVKKTVPRIDQLPPFVMTELPSMAFSAHMYSTDPKESWVRVNGQRKVEGELIDGKVRILHIQPQHVILNYEGHEFSMVAMTDW